MKPNRLLIAFILSLLMTTAALAMSDMQPYAGAGKAQPPIAGKVVEVLNSGGYTYLLIETDGFKDWVAVPALVVAVGDEVELEAGTQMGEFSSKPLNRTFPRIIFSAGPTEKYNERRKVNAHKGVDMSEPAPGKKKSDAKVVEGLKVEKAQGLNAYSIEELLANSSALQDRKIAVRGQVVKVSSGIMGKTWVHLKDGSGGPDGKLVVTTRDEPELGAIVTATGVLHLNVDFGGGYKYAVIMEDAAVK
jgi:hypothetical protein